MQVCSLPQELYMRINFKKPNWNIHIVSATSLNNKTEEL